MTHPRLSVLLSSVLVVPMALVIGTAGTAAAAPPSTTFGSHVASCAQTSNGFSGLHNPSHHAAHAGHASEGMHC